jgi:hypothetical protein
MPTVTQMTSLSSQYQVEALLDGPQALICVPVPCVGRFEFKEIVAAIQMERAATAGVGYSSFFKTKGNRHRLLILVVSLRKGCFAMSLNLEVYVEPAASYYSWSDCSLNGLETVSRGWKTATWPTSILTRSLPVF